MPLRTARRISSAEDDALRENMKTGRGPAGRYIENNVSDKERKRKGGDS